MTDHDANPVLLPGLLHAYGDRWQIAQDEDTAAWTAVERPTPTALHVIVAHTLTGLAEKLAKHEGVTDMLDLTAPDYDPDYAVRSHEDPDDPQRDGIGGEPLLPRRRPFGPI